MIESKEEFNDLIKLLKSKEKENKLGKSLHIKLQAFKEVEQLINKLTITDVVSSANELAQEFKEYTEKLLLSKKDTTDFLIRTGIIDSNGDLTEHYK